MDQEVIGADEEIRTPDPRITNALLYQLSYIGFEAAHYGAGSVLTQPRAAVQP